MEFLQQIADALDDHNNILHVIITLSSNFEPQFAGINSELGKFWTPNSRFVVTPMHQDELRQVIEGPAAMRVLYFDPDTLVDRLINEVVQTPGALPLLSFALSELYLKYLEHLRQYDAQGQNRALSEEDYDAIGGVAGALRNRAAAEYEQSDAAHQETMRRVMLRMVSLEAGELTRRRVPLSELVYDDPAENLRVRTIIRQLSQARLVIEGKGEDEEPYVEPAHDALIEAWDDLWGWIRDVQDSLILRRRLTLAATDWVRGKRATGLLWDGDPRLSQVQQILRTGENWLNSQDMAFVRASVTRRHRNRQLLTLGFAMLILATLAVVIATGGFLQQSSARSTAEATAEARRQETEKESRIARAREIANTALAELDVDPELSVLLAIEAVNTSHTFESEDALRQALIESHLCTTLRGHNPDGKTYHGKTSNWVGAVVFSADGQHLLTAGGDGTARVWEVPGGRQVALLQHSGWVDDSGVQS